jgi:hypothetical protein
VTVEEKQMSFKLLALSILLNVPALAQSSAERKAKYPSVEVYAIRSDVWLTPRFDNDGQLCHVALEKRNYSTFSQREIDELTNELVPVSARGAESKYFGTGSFIAGGSSAIEHVFEKVTITEYGAVNRGVSLLEIRWKDRPCTSNKPNEERR